MPSLVCERHSRSGQTSGRFFALSATATSTGRGAGHGVERTSGERIAAVYRA